MLEDPLVAANGVSNVPPVPGPMLWDYRFHNFFIVDTACTVVGRGGLLPPSLAIGVDPSRWPRAKEGSSEDQNMHQSSESLTLIKKSYKFKVPSG